MQSRAGWKWYGYAGHFIGGASCAFHMSTQVPGYLISTLGDYRPNKKRETLGADAESFFETFVFKCAGDDKYGNPILDYSEIDSRRYADSLAAERGHYEFCEKYAERKS